MSDDIKTVPSFAELGLSAPLLKALDEVGYEAPSPIQARTIPSLLAGRDLIGQAQTGTGKTGAFALPLLQRLDLARLVPQVLVLTPTRELAIQVAEAFQKYAHHLPGFHVLPIYGGQAYPIQLRPLQRGVHVIVGTPGRVIDHLKRGSLKLESLQAVVLDEADEMLNMGFLEDVEWILGQTPERRQVALFSATMPEAIKRIAAKHLHDPEHVALEQRMRAAETVRQRYWIVRPERKLDALTLLLEVETFDAMLVFVRTKNAAVEVAEKLEARGHAAAPLNGDIPQELRERTVERLRQGQVDVIVATDVAARGLDVERVSHVVNYDAPHDTESYVHRIGRTGRAGRTGEAVLFVTLREQRLLRVIERALGTSLEPLILPGTEAVNAQRRERLKRKLIEALEAEGLADFESVVAELAEQRGLEPTRIAAAAAMLAQGDQPLLLPERALPRTAGHFESRPERKPGPGRDWGPGREPGSGRDSGRRPPGEDGFAHYRAEVGHVNGLRPADLVGAITGESSLRGSDIGRIDIFSHFSIVDLPADLPEDMLSTLADLTVRRRRLGLRRLSAEEERELPRKGRERGEAGPPSGGRKPPFKARRTGETSDQAWRPATPPPHHGDRRSEPMDRGTRQRRPEDVGKEPGGGSRPPKRKDWAPPARPDKREGGAPPKKHRKGKGAQDPGKRPDKGGSKPPWFR